MKRLAVILAFSLGLCCLWGCGEDPKVRQGKEQSLETRVQDACRTILHPDSDEQAIAAFADLNAACSSAAEMKPPHPKLETFKQEVERKRPLIEETQARIDAVRQKKEQEAERKRIAAEQEAQAKDRAEKAKEAARRRAEEDEKANKTRAEQARTKSEKEQEQFFASCVDTVQAWLVDQRSGGTGISYWNPKYVAIAQSLYSVKSWEILSWRPVGDLSKQQALRSYLVTVMVRIASSTQGGFPIEKTYRIDLDRTNDSNWLIDIILDQ